MSDKKKALVGNAADEEQVKEATEKEKTGRDLELDDLKFILQAKSGRRFIWRLLSSSGYGRTSFSTNSLQMAFNEGQRNLGLQLLSDVMAADTGAFVRMQQESKDFHGG